MPNRQVAIPDWQRAMIEGGVPLANFQERDGALRKKDKPRQNMLSADVEFFLKDRTTKLFRPVVGLVGAQKGAPIWLDKYTGILEDNVALELNMPPANNYNGFHGNCENAMIGLQDWALNKNLEIIPHSSIEVDAKLLKEYPPLNEFGCSEDYIAYGDNPTKPRQPMSSKELGLSRFAAGHLHISYDITKIPQHVMIRWLDATLGLDSVSWDKQGLRRKYYGLAGLYRPTQYPDESVGVEYRTLSNSWFFDGTKTMYLAGAIFQLLHDLTKNIKVAKESYEMIPWKDVQEAINNEDKSSSKELVNYLVNNVPLLNATQNYLGKINRRYQDA